MRVLVLATPRSGSTSLTKLIYSHLELSEYTLFIEPFNSNFYKKYKIDGCDFQTYLPFYPFGYSAVGRLAITALLLPPC